MIICDYITSLRPFGGQIHLKADLPFMSLDTNELCTDTGLKYSTAGLSCGTF